LPNKDERQINNGLCSHLLEIGRSIRDANANFVPNEKYIFMASRPWVIRFPGNRCAGVRSQGIPDFGYQRLRTGLTLALFTGSQLELMPLCSLNWPSNVSAMSCRWEGNDENLIFHFRKQFNRRQTYLQGKGTNRWAGNGVARRVEDPVDQFRAHRAILSLH